MPLLLLLSKRKRANNKVPSSGGAQLSFSSLVEEGYVRCVAPHSLSLSAIVEESAAEAARARALIRINSFNLMHPLPCRMIVGSSFCYAAI